MSFIVFLSVPNPHGQDGATGTWNGPNLSISFPGGPSATYLPAGRFYDTAIVN